MLIRLSGWGLALLAAGSLASFPTAQAQDPIPAKVPPAKTTPEPAKTDPVPPEPKPATPPAAPAETKPASPPDALTREREIEDRAIERSRRQRPVKIEYADPWTKHPPIWSIRDDSHTAHPYARPSQPAPGMGHFPGGPTGRWGLPYYYTRTGPDTAYGEVAGVAAYHDGSAPGGLIGPMGPGGPSGPIGQMGPVPSGGSGGRAPCCNNGGSNGPIGPGAGSEAYGPGYAGPGYGANYAGPGYAPGPAGQGYGPAPAGPGYGGPGYGGPPPSADPAAAYGPKGVGPVTAALPGQMPGNPYLYHFGPGFYRFQEAGHYSFPYYSYRRPWYFPGHTSYNRDTNVPW